jgi:septal ring factor EnvC (AmiA/AmiB activator)
MKKVKRELGQLLQQYRAVEYLKNRKAVLIYELQERIKKEERSLQELKSTEKSLLATIKKKDPSFSHE